MRYFVKRVDVVKKFLYFNSFRLQSCSCLKFWPTKMCCLISWSSWRRKHQSTYCSSICPLVCWRPSILQVFTHCTVDTWTELSRLLS